jgi:septation ring formation regulator EzrA
MKKEKTDFTAREVGVLIEDLKSQFRTFGEDLSAVKQKVDAIFEEQGRQKETIFLIKADINAIKTILAEIKNSLKDHEQRLAHLETGK